MQEHCVNICAWRAKKPAVNEASLKQGIASVLQKRSSFMQFLSRL